MRIVEIVIGVGLIFGCEGVRFILPPGHRSLSDHISELSSSGSSGSNSSTDSSVEFVKSDNGRFSHLRKDDDLLVLKKNKKRNRNHKKKQRPPKAANVSIANVSNGGKQTVGFIWQKGLMEKAEGNGWSQDLVIMTAGIVNEPINVGWWMFTFGNGKSTVSKTSFKFKTKLPVRVSLVDLYCRGDSFAVLDSDRLIAQSSRIPVDKGCSERMISPEEALNDGRWSSVVFELEAGDHEITIKTIDSPVENGGTAAIKFEYILPDIRKLSRNKVCSGFNGLIVITEPMLADEAELACLNMKSDIARIGDDSNEVVVRKSIKSCTTGEMKVFALDAFSGVLKVFGRDGKIVNGKMKEKEKYLVLCRARK